MIPLRPAPGSARHFAGAALSRWRWRKSLPPLGPLWLDDTVRLAGAEECSPCAASLMEHSDELLDVRDPVLVHAERVLRAWPQALHEVRSLLDVIQSWRPRGVPFALEASGGSCGPGIAGWGSVMVSASNPVGYAEGVVHELAHHKLRAIGVEMEEHDGKIITNDPAEMYESGVRKDKPRPMSAVLHAHYSYLHVTEIEVRAHATGYSMLGMLPHQVRRLTEGRAVIAAHARWAQGMEPVRDLILEWTDHLLGRCEGVS
ncbi:MAG: HEXXH motif-containing putative peptide modification protein [Dehalococcoidia bacterium]|nr:HEXXH motif-containing putative peptide modification protein [Dehalococcoidia bacterium]